MKVVIHSRSTLLVVLSILLGLPIARRPRWLKTTNPVDFRRQV
jgi:hypothetical protein